jgi:hypothetical protein
MRGWRPCQPSAELRKRIFASEGAPVEFARAPLDWAGFMRWLVPAMGCCVVVTGIALDPSTNLPSGARETMGTQQVAYSLEAGRKGWGGSKNTIPAKNLEWTFAQRSSSSTDSFVGSDTNMLRK